MRIIVLSLIAILGLVSTITAGDDCYPRCRTIYPTYYQQPYYNPAPYYEPSPYYDPGYKRYSPPYYDFPLKEQVILVPKAIEVEVHRDHYYSIDSYYQQSLLADAIVGRLMLMNGKTQSTPVAQTRPLVNTTTSNPLTVSASGTPVSAYQNNELSLAFKTNCASCHNGSQHTAFLSADDKLLDLPKSKVLEVFHLVNTGRMPKNQKPLEDKYMALIDAWVGASK